MKKMIFYFSILVILLLAILGITLIVRPGASSKFITSMVLILIVINSILAIYNGKNKV